MIAGAVGSAVHAAFDMLITCIRIIVLLVRLTTDIILCGNGFLRFSCCCFMGRAAASAAGFQLRFTVRLADRQRDRIRVNHRRLFRAKIGLRDDAAVFRAAHALRGLFDGQRRRVPIQIGPAAAVRSALPAIGNAPCSSGRGCRNGKYSIGTGANTRIHRLFRDIGLVSGRQCSDRQRLGIIRGCSVRADRLEHILILRARLYFGIGQRVFAFLGCQTAYRAQQCVLRAAGVVRHIAVDLILRCRGKAALPLQGHAVGGDFLGFQILRLAGRLLYVCHQIAQHRNIVRKTTGRQRSLPADKLPLEAVARCAGRQIVHGAAALDTLGGNAARAAAGGRAAAQTELKSAETAAALGVNIKGKLLCGGLRGFKRYRLGLGAFAGLGCKPTAIRALAGGNGVFESGCCAAIGRRLTRRGGDDVASDFGVAVLRRRRVILRQRNRFVGRRVRYRDIHRAPGAVRRRGVIVIDCDRNTDQHYRAFRLLGGEAVGHSETLLYFNGVVPLGFKRGFKFKSAKIDDAAYGEILREGNIGADTVRGAGAGGAAAALGERDRGLAGVVVLDILEIRRRLHNGKHLRIVKGVFLALIVCNNAVAVDIRRRQRDFGDAPCVHTPAAASQTVFGVVHHIFALACALIRTGCLAAVVVRRLVVIAADVYGAAVSGRYRKQNLLTTRRVAVKVADNRLVDDRAVLQNIVQTIGFYLRSFQRSVIVLEDLTADDDIRHSAASVKPHDTQRTRVHIPQI